MTGIERAAAGEPKIKVDFVVDMDDILTVTAHDLRTGCGGEIRIERFEPAPYQPKSEDAVKDLKSVRIGVSQPGCDDAGQVIGQMGLRYTVLGHTDFRDARKLSHYDLVFINCLADFTQCFGGGLRLNPKKNAPALQQFVADGGTLYVSDFALDNISVAFPGRITFGAKGEGPAGKTVAAVIDPELRDLLGPDCPIDFNTVYAPVRSVGESCCVYLTKGTEPILVSFPHGNGHVVYTSFPQRRPAF